VDRRDGPCFCCWYVGVGRAGKIGLGAKVGYHNFIRYSQVDDPDNDGVLEDGEIDYAIDSGAFNGVTIETISNTPFRRTSPWAARCNGTARRSRSIRSPNAAA
jgi:hypothetical protein